MLLIEEYKRNKELVGLIISGIAIGIFLGMILKVENIHLYIIGVTLFLFIGKYKKIDYIAHIYYSIRSDQIEKIVIVVLLVLSFYMHSGLNYFYIFIYFINFNVLFYLLFNDIFIKEKEEQIKMQEKLILSFRQKELEQLEMLIKDPMILSVLLDDKIGNGKTFLLELLLENLEEDLEIIYLKLPLVESSDNLIEIILNEIFKILKKNKIFMKKEDIFFKKLEKIKIGCFEFKNNNSKSNWDSIKELKKGIIELSNKKQILIVLDDIEREESDEKIKKSILFLGELSEYLRNTKMTFLYIAQYEKISKSFNNDESIDLFEKYFSQIMRLYSPKFRELKEDDLKILIKEQVGSLNEEKKEIDEHAIIILELLKVLDSLKISLKNENLRTLVRYIMYFKESIMLESVSNNSTLIWAYIYKSFEVFYPDLEYEHLKKEELPETIYKELSLRLKYKISFVDLDSVLNTKENIEKIYLMGGLRKKNNRLNLEKILEYLKGKKIDLEKIMKEIKGTDVINILENVNKNNLGC